MPKSRCDILREKNDYWLYATSGLFLLPMGMGTAGDWIRSQCFISWEWQYTISSCKFGVCHAVDPS